jgi:signal transduction histidine kinase/ligand-binding sensor domain-containing protein
MIPRFEVLSVDNGLSQSSVYSIHQDKIGFMWFGTSNGLNRYDGKNVKVFRAQGPPLQRANVNFVRGKLCEDKRGRIWYSNETGIYYYDPVKEKIMRAYDLMPDSLATISFNYYTTLALDDAENLWLSTSWNELVRFSVTDMQLQHIPLPAGVEKTDYIKHGNMVGNTLLLYLNQKGRELSFDLTSFTFDWIRSHPNTRIISTHGSRTYFKDAKKLSWLDSLMPSKINPVIEVESEISNIMRDPYDRIWISTFGSGLYCYYPSTNQIVNYRHENSKLKSLPFDITTCLFVDNTNNLWIGTDGGGVAWLDLKPSRFEIFPLNQGDYPALSDYFVRCLYEDRTGRIWFGTLHNGLCIYDPKDGSFANYSNRPGDVTSLPANKIGAIFEDRDHNMWIGHSNGVSIFDEQKKVFINSPFSQLFGEDVYKFIQLDDGTILVGTSKRLMLIAKKDNRYQIDRVDLDVSLTDMQLAPNGDLWTTSREGGLFHVAHNGKEYKNKANFFSGVNTRSIHFDEQDPELAWVCSGAGLIRLNIKSGSYKVYNYENGMPDNYLYGLLEDKRHNFWMSSNTGLYYFNRSDEQFVNYSVKDGLQSNEFNSRAFHKGASGKFYFGGINGFNYFDPDGSHSQLTPPKVMITSILVNGRLFVNDRTRAEAEPITLNYFENDLAFSIAVPDYTRPVANQIQYKLQGWDKDFITSPVNNINYSNLPPGNYRLRIRASNDGQIWGTEQNLYVNILSPFWRTNFFYGGIIALAVGSIVLTTRAYYRRKVNLRMRELEKQQAVLQERERISKDIHDDLGAGLSTIGILSELVKQNSKQDEFTRKQLTKISESSRHLIENLGELVWAHNPVNDSLLKLLWYLREHLGGMFEGTSTRLQIIIPEHIDDRPLQVEWRRNIFLITKEALHNVLKHAHATMVDLTVAMERDSLIITVRDNGVGFDAGNRMTKGNGLGNMEKRAKACNADIKIESRPGAGTSITISVFLTS